MGCDSVFVTTLTVNSTYDVPQTATICEGESLALNAGSGYTSYLWSDTTITDIKDDWFTMSAEATVTDTTVTFTIQGTIEKVAKTFSGLDHLEGMTVSVLGDGAVHKDVVVTNGSVTLDEYYNKVHIGVPYNSELLPMKPEVQTQSGSSRSKVKRIHEADISFLNSLGCEYGELNENGTAKQKLDIIPFRKTTDATGRAVPLFTGDKLVSFDGEYGLEGNIFIRQSQPLPLTVRSITTRMKIYD